MTREEFIEILDEKRYSYEIEGDKIVVTHNGKVHLSSLETLPSGVKFKNGGDVYLESLKTLPPDTIFGNRIWGVYLESLKTISPGVEFKNQGGVFLNSLETISPGVVFKNRWRVRSNSLFDGFLDDWSGNIEGIGSNRLLNKMISDGLFDRR
jgi:hypothetical protein